MAIGDNYLTVSQVKTWMGLQGPEFDEIVSDVVDSISRDIELHCHRQFNKEAAPSARVYDATRAGLVIVDDFYTGTGLIVETDNDGDGVFETTWDASWYELRPLNGVRNGMTGFPYWQIVARVTKGRYFPCNFGNADVRVTAAWGWSSVPSSVVQSAKILAADTFQLKDSRLGVAGSDQFGTIVRVRDNRIVQNRLKNYVRESVFVG